MHEHRMAVILVGEGTVAELDRQSAEGWELVSMAPTLAQVGRLLGQQQAPALLCIFRRVKQAMLVHEE